MKATIKSCVLAICLASESMASTPFPLPQFLPMPPAADKPVANYTSSDVVGLASIDASRLPRDHQFLAGGKFFAGLRSNWPGATDASKIDEFIQWVIDSPKSALTGTSINVRYIILKVMNVTDEARTDAILRVAAVQVDPEKKFRVAGFASRLFEDLLDSRLLGLIRNSLNDDTVVAVRDLEDGHPEKFTARSQARGRLLYDLENILKMVVNDNPFYVRDEALGCLALRQWLDAHWAEITAKCVATKANPKRKSPSVSLHPWDPRS